MLSVLVLGCQSDGFGSGPSKDSGEAAAADLDDQ
jgi:hypothetical protein